MPNLCIIIETKVQTTLLHGDTADYITYDNRRFSQRTLPEQLVFYDWLFDSKGVIRALEIHLPINHPLFMGNVPLSQFPYIDSTPYVTIWLSEKRDGVAQGLEAFGDISFFGAADGHLAIVVGIDEWLAANERNRIVNETPFNGV